MISERDIMGGLAKGLGVIATFAPDRPRQSIAEVAQASGLDRATARRCLLTLAHEGYADYDGKFFTLTPKVLRLGIGCLAAMPLPQVVQPLLDRLSDKLGQSSSVSILDGDEIVYVARAAQKRLMSIALMPGSRLPAYCTSMGRVLLAARSAAEIAALLGAGPYGARTPQTKTTLQEVLAATAQARVQGYAVIEQEVEQGLCSLAVPIYNSRAQVVAAINFGLPATETPLCDRLGEYLPALLATQAELRSLLH